MKYYDEIPGFEVKKASYKKSGQTADTAIPFYGTEDLKIIPTHTQLHGIHLAGSIFDI